MRVTAWLKEFYSKHKDVCFRRAVLAENSLKF